MPSPGPCNFSEIVDYIYDLYPVSDPVVGPSVIVCDVEHTCFHFGMCGHKCVLYLFGECPVVMCANIN